MNLNLRIPHLLLAALLLPAAALGIQSTGPARERPATPATPAPVNGIVSIQPFELETEALHFWRAEKPAVRTGYLLVLRVDPALVYPRQVAEPVLYVGHQTAERVNVGFESGHVVAILPAAIDPQHPDYVDLSTEIFWFGTPELPEQVDARRIAQEHRLARTAGVRPFPAKQLAAARERGGALNRQPGKRALLHDALRRLVRTYSPQERELVEGALGTEPRTPR